MVLDASAIIAALAGESDAASLVARIDRANKTYITPIGIYETAVGLARSKNVAIADATREVERFLAEAGTETVAISDSMGRTAIDAFARFGKGRHRAGLNMGDCFSYAAAKALSQPLLFRGDDFPLTDVKAA